MRKKISKNSLICSFLWVGVLTASWSLPVAQIVHNHKEATLMQEHVYYQPNPETLEHNGR